MSSKRTFIVFQLSCGTPPRVAGLNRHLASAWRRVASKNAALVALTCSTAFTRPSAPISTRTDTMPSRGVAHLARWIFGLKIAGIARVGDGADQRGSGGVSTSLVPVPSIGPVTGGGSNGTIVVPAI